MAVLWLLVALLPKLLLPTGFMPGDASTGRLVVICSAGFFKAAQVDERGIIIKRERRHASATHCPFAHVAGAPLPDLSGSEAITFVDAAVFLPLTELPYYAAGPPRIHHVRGPPNA
jgi:hypothetical protein